MALHCKVNAGFRRFIPRLNRRMRLKAEWKNVQGIIVPLPEARCGEKEFRDTVQRNRPEGIEWMIQGYVVIEEFEVDTAPTHSPD